MPSLSRVDDRFEIPITIIDGGSGQFHGIITEPGQGQIPPSQFNLPRLILRVASGVPIKAGMVIRSPAGTVFMVADYGSSEGPAGITFDSFRLFEASGQFSHQTRGKKLDVVTKLQTDNGLIDQPPVWGAYEPSPEMFDRGLRANLETGRFITNADIQRDEMVDGRRVSRVDVQLGLRIVTLG